MAFGSGLNQEAVQNDMSMHMMARAGKEMSRFKQITFTLIVLALPEKLGLLLFHLL